MIGQLINIFIFPGFLFFFLLGLTGEYIDRKFSARLQNRVGPPWFQPVADLIKLIAKEDTITDEADPIMFRLMPVLTLSCILTSILYIPMWKTSALYSFNGDMIVVLYLLTIPTLAYFLGGWYSRSVFSMIGGIRALTQLFAYEVPLFVALISPAILADTWSLSGIAGFYAAHPQYIIFNIPGFCIGLIALLGKLEKTPFDIPEAETEIVAGSFTEYSGRLLAIFRTAINIEMVVGAALLSAVFLPFGLNLGPVAGGAIFLLKILLIVLMISTIRTVLARIRLDQMIEVCWKVFAPIAFLQMLLDLFLKAVLFK